MTEQEILLQITELKERATAASMTCIKYAGKTEAAKYLEAVRVHGVVTKQIDKLKNMLNEKTA